MKAISFLKLAVTLILLFVATGQNILGQQNKADNKPDYEKAMKFVKDKVINNKTPTCYDVSGSYNTFDYDGTNVTTAFYAGADGRLWVKYKFSMEDFDPSQVEVTIHSCKNGHKDRYEVYMSVKGKKEKVQVKTDDGEKPWESGMSFYFEDKELADRVAKALKDAIQAAQDESPY